MPADAIQLGEVGVFADFRKTMRQLALLRYREKDVGAHTYHQ